MRNRIFIWLSCILLCTFHWADYKRQYNNQCIIQSPVSEHGRLVCNKLKELAENEPTANHQVSRKIPKHRPQVAKRSLPIKKKPSNKPKLTFKEQRLKQISIQYKPYIPGEMEQSENSEGQDESL